MTTALIVIDVQNIYTDESSEMYCEGASSTIGRINRLIARFERQRQPIFLVRHVHLADGSDLGRMFDYTGEPEPDFNFKAGTPETEYDSRLKRPDEAIHLVKTRYSAFRGTELHDLLRHKGISTVVICGFMTNFCCESTARDAHDLDYFVDFIVDATGTPGTDNLNQRRIRKIVAELLEAGFSRVSSTKAYLTAE